MAARWGDARIMARSLAALSAVGPVVGMLWLAIPGHGHVPVAGAAVVVALSWALAAVLFSGRLDDSPPWVFQAFLAVATLATSPAVYWTADPSSTFALFYVWATPYAFCWFSLRHAALQTAFACVCYFGALSLSHGLTGEGVRDHLADVLLLGSTIVAVGLFARRLVHGLRGQERLRVHRASVLADFGRSSLDAVALQPVLDEGVRIAEHELCADFVLIAEVVDDGASDELRVAAVAGPSASDRLPVGRRFAGSDRSLLGHAIRVDEPVTTDDLRVDPRIDLSPALRLFGVRTAIAVAVRGRTGRRLGMGVYRTTRSPFAADDPSFVHALANVVAAAVERFADEAELRRQALHDPLTGLPNRTLMTDRLRHALLGAQRAAGDRVAVVVIDVDRFKNVNDSLGHAFGDHLLLVLARRLSEAVRASDTLARLGGDEFVVIAERVRDADHARDLAERVSRAWDEPLQVEGRVLHLRASVGVALSDDTSTPDELVANADAAMYRAKRERPGSVELYDERLRQRVSRDLRLEQELRVAIDRDELLLHFQPIVDPASLRCTEVEALVRWNHPERGLVSPGRFIALAEDSGLIVPLGERVLDLALAQVAAWRASGLTELSVSCNVSARQLRHPGFAQHVHDQLDAHGVPAGALAVEITEHVVLDPRGPAAATACELHELGIRLMLDDFGTGYSSLSSLRALPVSVLKIDRSFIAGLGTDAADTGIVGGVLHLARGAGLEVVAEGVETAEQAALLSEMGCDRAQGFYFARPLAADAAGAFLRDGAARAA
jgi:diguanylate cyclase (GGDEF)-like protein